MLDVLVVGCGPTGIAALTECKINGLTAIGIEGGGIPLSNISKYPDGLIFFSPAEHFQIIDIPLDCKDRRSVSKEEVLYYYSRIINRYNLKIENNVKFIGLEKCKNGWIVICEAPSGTITFLSKRIIFTAWYKIKEIKHNIPLGSRVKIHSHFKNAIEFAGKRIIVAGGGISACEACCFLMMTGHQLILLLRDKKTDYHSNSSFVRLLEITKSEIVENASIIEIMQNGVLVRIQNEVKHWECDDVIMCAGQELNIDAFMPFLSVGVLSKRMFDKLCKIEPFTKIKKRSENPDDHNALLEKTIKNWPNLNAFLTTGVQGVFFAGAALHVGASSAGLRLSIKSASIIVDQICDKSKTNKHVNAQQMLNEVKSHYIKITEILDIYPIMVNSWTRNTISLSYRENDFGDLNVDSTRSYFLGSKKNAVAKKILKLSDGKHSVRNILEKYCNDENAAKQYIEQLYYLFYNNAITWLPISV